MRLKDSQFRLLLDRTAVLFLGVAAGAAIGHAFADSPGDAPPAAPVSVAAPSATPSPTKAAATTTVLAPDCPLEFSRPVAKGVRAAVEGGDKINVGVFGDSFGDGLWAALYHQLPARNGFRVEKYSQQSTGFTRYASLNLEQRLASQLAGKRIDIAVISFGANDTQGVMHGGHVATLLSPAWKDEIGKRIDRYVSMLRAHGAQVYWVGLPVMRKADYDANISEMNAFYAEHMARLGVPFIETRSLSVDSSGRYAAYLPDPATGTPQLMRANDGIHMSMNGYARLTAGLAKRIRDYVASARDVATPPVSATRDAVKDGSGA